MNGIHDNWKKLKYRLGPFVKARDDGVVSSHLVLVRVYLEHGYPVWWYKPEKVLLEPNTICFNDLLSFTGDLEQCVKHFVNGQTNGLVCRTLVVTNGEVRGWLDMEQVSMI